MGVVRVNLRRIGLDVVCDASRWLVLHRMKGFVNPNDIQRGKIQQFTRSSSSSQVD